MTTRAQSETVHDRITRLGGDVTTRQVVIGLTLSAALGFVLLFMQDPLVHDALHNFRHSAGITCH